MQAGGAAVYLYGIVSCSCDELLGVRGIGGAHVRTVGQEGLLALVSPLDEPTLGPADVRAHWRVLECAFEHATVLPIRFGTVMDSEADVRERLLEAGGAELRQLLGEMAGHAQFNVRGRYEEEPLLRKVVADSPRIARLRETLRELRQGGAATAERVQLGQLVEAEIARCRAEDTEDALAELEPIAVATLAEAVNHPDAFRLALLVDREREGRLSQAVAGLRARFGERVAIRYVGSLPPFSFAEADLAAGSGAWA